ncbi:response regulator [Sulfurimonas sp. SAG-AH-194-I05]|nr:response regulator [Sulfurimonas sp. SAG-AH-194-I05]MDF1874216.1 response regulator [Sulfurimonas sp. SAG-AH-194-I05]
MKRYKILIVEDSKLVSKIVYKHLDAYGYICDQAMSFEKAREYLSEKEYDFIILDLHLPDAYGEELVYKVMKRSKAKILVLTAEKDLELREALYKDGILDYLIKDKHFNDSIRSMHNTMQTIWDNERFTVLSIEDSRYMREQVSKVLSVRNYNVLSARDAKQGMTFLTENTINVIVLDIELPDRNGMDVLRELKNQERYAHIPVMVLSGSSNQETIRECLKIGAFDFIHKPFNIEEFVLKIDRAISINKKDVELLSLNNLLQHNLDETSLIAREYQDAINKSNILSHCDINHKITAFNEKFKDICGFKGNESIGKTHEELSSSDTFSKVYAEIIKTIENGNVWTGKITGKKRNGSLYYTETTVMPIYDMNKNIIEYLWMSSDITVIMNIHYEIEETQKEMIYKMGEIAESRSEETGNHVKRVALCSKELALLAGVSDTDAQVLYHASPMHDIGKVAIPDNILQKPGKLNPEEWVIMQTHASIGYQLFKDSKRPILQASAIVAYTHHEKWDGSGYPNALQGEDIHIFGRLTAIADVFDALASDRVYKKAWKDADIKAFFIENSGTHFDPNITKIFLENFSLFLGIRERYR